MINSRHEIRRSLAWFSPSARVLLPSPQPREFIPAALRHAKTHRIIKASYFTASRRPQCLGEEYGLLRLYLFRCLAGFFVFSPASSEGQRITAAKRKRERNEGEEKERNGVTMEEETKFGKKSFSYFPCPLASARSNPVNRRVSG